MSVGKISPPVNTRIDCITDLPVEILRRIVEECMYSLKAVAPVCKKFQAIVKEVSGRSSVEAMAARVFIVNDIKLTSFCAFRDGSLVYTTDKEVKKIDFNTSKIVAFQAETSYIPFIDHHPVLGFHFRNDPGEYHRKQLIDFTHKKLGPIIDGETRWVSKSHDYDLDCKSDQITLKKGSFSETHSFPNLKRYDILFINDAHIFLNAGEILYIINRNSSDLIPVCEEYWFVHETDQAYILGTTHSGNIQWDVLGKEFFEVKYSLVDYKSYPYFDFKNDGNLVFYTLEDGRLAFTNIQDHYSCILPTKMKKTCNFHFSYPLVAFQNQTTDAIEIWNASARICLFSKKVFNHFRLGSFDKNHLAYYEKPNRIKILSSSHLSPPPGIEAKYETFWDRLHHFIIRIFKAIKEWFKEIKL